MHAHPPLPPALCSTPRGPSFSDAAAAALKGKVPDEGGNYLCVFVCECVSECV